jgi:LysM repeat protein
MVVRIERGDSLDSLASKYHTTKEKIVDDNQLQDACVHIGQRLLVEGYLVHLWLPSDSLQSVCAKYGVAEANVKEANGRLEVGRIIKIPI